MIWLFLFLNFSAAEAPRCVDLFSVLPETTQATDRAFENLLLEARELTDLPSLLIDAPTITPEVLYLELMKIDARLWSDKTPLGPDLLQRLQSHFGERYHIPTTEREQRQFYSNALQSLYSRVAWNWKKQVLESIAGEKLNGSVLQTAQGIMDQHYSTLGFTERAISMEKLEQFFIQKPWVDLNWPVALEIVKRWHASPESKRGFTGFYKWLEGQTDLPALTHRELEMIYMALMRRSSPIVCCKSSFACTACPNNLSWIKKSE